VVHTTLQKNLKIAFWVILGGVLCETGYAFLAMKGVLIFDKYPQLDYWIHWAIIILLFVVGLITFFQKTEEIKKEKVLINNKLISFFKGVSLSLFNPALIPFWLIVLLEYRKWQWLKMNSILDDLAFVFGAGSGTLLLVFTYAFIANKKRNLIFKYLTDSRLNKVMGSIFIGLALWQLVNIWLRMVNAFENFK
jgi:threonine/homoserine/homoserine lactone efflux protein